MSIHAFFFQTSKSLAPLALRIPLAIIMMAHGAQKLFGWFEGGGIHGTSKFMESLGLHPSALMAILAGGAEFFGGLFVLLGLFTRPSAIVLAITMLVAIFSVHFSNGLFASRGGYEFALALLAMCISLAVSGADKLSLDRLFIKNSYR